MRYLALAAIATFALIALLAFIMAPLISEADAINSILR